MHPSAATLQAYRDGELPQVRMERIAQHLGKCETCRRVSEQDAWRVEQLLESARGPAEAGESAIPRARIVSEVQALLRGEPAITKPLLQMLVGRKAGWHGEIPAGRRRKMQPVTITVMVATAVHLVLGCAAWLAWQITGDPAWVRSFFQMAGDMFLADLSAAGFYLALQVWQCYSRGEPLYQGWFLITASAACGLAGSIFSKILAHCKSAHWASIGSRELLEFGLLLGGPLSMALMLAGFVSVLRAYDRSGIMTWRSSWMDRLVFVAMGTYTVVEGVQVFTAFQSGVIRTAHDFIKATNDPLLLMLLGASILLRNSVRQIGDGHIARTWGAFMAGICMVFAGNIIQWGWNYQYLPQSLVSASWYIWFVAGACYVVAPGFQLEATERSTASATDSVACSST